MSPEFMGMLRESEIQADQRIYREYLHPKTVHRLPPRDTKQYAYGEFSGSPSSNNRLDFPTY